MRRTRILPCAFLASLAISAIPHAQSSPATVPVTVTRVVDGDTVWADRQGGQVQVRLHGIDAPEGPQRFGAEAAAFASSLLLGRQAIMTPKDVDRHNRVVARLAVDGRDAAELIVGAGLAWHDTRFAPRDATLAAAERAARDAGRGLWADAAPLPPWEFRRAAPPARSSAEIAYRGNRNSQVFHAPGCRDYDCKNCTVMLGSVDLARARGFRPHAACVR